MRQSKLIIIFISILFSCSKSDEKVIRNHEILITILNDRLQLENRNILIPGTYDTIRVKDIILIAESKCDIEFDSTKNNLTMFNSISPDTKHPFYEDSVEYILRQLPKLLTHSWDSTFLRVKVKIEDPETKFDKSIKYKTELWVSGHKKDNSYLVVTEPIENQAGEVLISAKIFAVGYNIEKCYIMYKSETNWKIKESLTALSRTQTEFLGDREKEIEIFIGYTDN